MGTGTKLETGTGIPLLMHICWQVECPEALCSALRSEGVRGPVQPKKGGAESDHCVQLLFSAVTILYRKKLGTVLHSYNIMQLQYCADAIFCRCNIVQLHCCADAILCGYNIMRFQYCEVSLLCIYNIIELKYCQVTIFNRPGVAGAVLQTPLSMIN